MKQDYMDGYNVSKETAVNLYGSQVGLAAALGVDKSAVSLWSWSKPIPARHALALRFILRPDDFDPPKNKEPQTWLKVMRRFHSP